MGRPSKLEQMIDAATIKELKISQEATLPPPLYGYHFTIIPERSEEVLAKQIKVVKSIAKMEDGTVVIVDNLGNKYHTPHHNVLWYKYE